MKYVIVLLLLLPVSISANIIYVPADFATIQEAIDVANNYDTVIVADGIYSGLQNTNLDMHGRSITVESENGPDDCIIDCEYSGRGFYFHSGENFESVVRGITIRNGKTDQGENGGGIACINASAPTIDNCSIENCSGLAGAGVSCIESSPHFLFCRISGNRADHDGGGIYFSHSHSQLRYCTIVDNKALQFHGGGVYVQHKSYIQFFDCVIRSNTALNGGGICVLGSSGINFENGLLELNRAENGGGAFCSYSSVYLYSSEIINNLALFGVGVNFGKTSVGYLENSVFESNVAKKEGGGNYYFSGSVSTIKNCSYFENTAEKGGALYYGSGSAPILESCDLQYNKAGLSGGAIYIGLHDLYEIRIGGYSEGGNNFCGNIAGSGADIFSRYSFGSNAVYNNHFAGNYRSDYYVYPQNHFYFESNISDMELMNEDLYVTVDGNDNNDGITWDSSLKTIQYALSIIDYESYPKTIHLGTGVFSPDTTGEVFPLPLLTNISIIGSGRNETIIDAAHTNRVFTVYETDSALLSDLTITGGVSDIGAGIYCKDSTLEVKRCLITGNTATDKGGGMYVSTLYTIFGPVIGGSNDDANHFSENSSGSGLGADLYSARNPNTVMARYNSYSGDFEDSFYVYPRDM
ncbi:right-handed parallel beta-helix repeat-containing protein, partial [bacterium]|nr:right-handed parallel beta-helix repeat-containing protein [bacterium]